MSNNQNNQNNQELLEKIEYLRENADVGYEEALTLLERFDGDMTRVLVELERGNRIRRQKRRPPEFAEANCFHGDFRGDFRGRNLQSAYYEEKRRRHHDNMNKIVDFLFHKSIVISKNERTIINLPIVFYIGGFLLAPYMMFPALILIFITGCRINGERSNPRNPRDSVNDFVCNAASNVRTTFDSVTSSIRNDFGDKKFNGKKPDGAPEDKQSGDGSEYTID